MKRMYVVCEGQTEETFVREILEPYFQALNLFLTPIPLDGVSTYGKIKTTIKILCKQEPSVFVTSMIDLYGLPENFPEKDSFQQEKDPYKKIQIAETAFKNDINQRNFIPNLLLHEFEALLFSDLEKFRGWVNNPEQIDILEIDVKKFDTPEHINDSKETAPSKRLKLYFKNYEKVSMGSLIAIDIGLHVIRQKCHHFNQWLLKLEQLVQN